MKTWRTSSLAVSKADGSLGRGTKCIVLENLSTIASLVVLPLKDGRPVTKSKGVWDQDWWGTVSGQGRPAGALWDALPQAQMKQAETNSLASTYTEGRQKC